MSSRNPRLPFGPTSSSAMATWRIGESIFRGLRGFRGHSRPGRVLLCAAALLAALIAATLGLRHAHAQSPQPDRQPQSQSRSQPSQQPDSQADPQASAQPDTSSDANSNLNDPPPVLPTDPPGWKPEPSSTDVPAPILAPAPASKSAPVPSAQTAPASSSDAPKPADAIALPVKPAIVPLPTDPRQRRVAVECADLLQMATDLKAAVDKSTKDELSIDVVRKANEIEQYARKVRAGTQLTAGKE